MPQPERLMQCASIQLFVDRAQAVRPDFQVTPRNAATMAELCRRLEGLPLALELAAARAGVLTPAQMLARLEQRFELLTSRHRAADPRHGSLRAALDWSYQLLSPELQRFFARLSVFQGGWTLEAAEAVCNEPLALEYLEQLREVSLIVAEDRAGIIRCRLSETLREYGREQLSPEEQAAVARRHLSYYAALAEQAELLLRGAEQESWYERLETEHENLRAALDWVVGESCADPGTPRREGDGSKDGSFLLPAAITLPAGGTRLLPGDVEAGLRLGGALGNFWMMQGHLREGCERLIALLALPAAAARTPVRATALVGAGLLAAWLGDLRMARTLLEESLAIQREHGDERGAAWSLGHLGIVFNNEGNFAAARSLHHESLAIRRRLGDPWELTMSLNHLGRAVLRDGDLAAARALHEEGLAIGRTLGDKRGVAWSLNFLAHVTLREGELERARELYQESLTIWREIGNNLGSAWSLNGLGRIAQQQGDLEAAHAYHHESLVMRRELGDRRGIAECLEGMAQAVGGQGQRELAVRLFAAAHVLRQTLGLPLPPQEQSQQAEQLAALRTALGEAAFTAAWEAGQAITREHAGTLVLVPEALSDPAPVRQMPPPTPVPSPGALPPSRGDLTAQEWERIAPLLPDTAPRRGRPYEDHRRIINGILWVKRTDAAWRDLPAHYGSWHTCHDRFRRWQRSGLWDRIVQALQYSGETG